MVEKENLREAFRGRVQSLTLEQRAQQSKSIFDQVVRFLDDHKGETWSLYAPLHDEPNILECVTQLPQIRWVFPKIEATGTLSFHEVQSLSNMEPNSWGLLQPKVDQCSQVSSTDIHGFIIPALAYDISGVRLGRGGGFYDQTLENHSGPKIGVIFEKNLSEEPLPKEHHDQNVDFVVTSNKWIQVRGQSWK